MNRASPPPGGGRSASVVRREPGVGEPQSPHPARFARDPPPRAGWQRRADHSGAQRGGDACGRGVPELSRLPHGLADRRFGGRGNGVEPPSRAFQTRALPTELPYLNQRATPLRVFAGREPITRRADGLPESAVPPIADPSLRSSETTRWAMCRLMRRSNAILTRSPPQRGRATESGPLFPRP